MEIPIQGVTEGADESMVECFQDYFTLLKTTSDPDRKAFMLGKSNQRLQTALGNEKQATIREKEQRELAEERYDLAYYWVNDLHDFIHDEMAGVPNLQGARLRMLDKIMRLNQVLLTSCPQEDLMERQRLEIVNDIAVLKRSNLRFRMKDRTVPLLR